MTKIIYGLKNLHYAPITIGEGGAVTYGKPVAIPGAREMGLDAQGEDTKVYADDTQYVVISVNTGYEGDLTVLKLPDSFYTECLGQKVDANGALVESEDDIKNAFALLGEFSTESAEKKRFVLYNCIAGRPTFGGSTKEETVEATELVVPIVAAAASDTGATKATITNTASPEKFAGWFDAVYVPVEA